jgi:putative transposase
MSTDTWTFPKINISGTVYYLTSLLDSLSGFIVHWEIRESMTERNVETIVQRALEQHPNEKPWIISDNGPEFIARDFKKLIRLAGITRVCTGPHYPQSNAKLKRWHGSLKHECVRPTALNSLEEARKCILLYVDHYNNCRLHSVIGYVTPADKLAGLDEVIFAERDRKLEEAQGHRARARLAPWVTA